MSFFHTTEFYVILFLVAAAILAFIAKPHTATVASEHLLGSILSNSHGNTDDTNATSDIECQPSISIDCDDNGCVWLRRNAISGVDASGAVSAKIVVTGTNITVYERVTEGRYGDSPVDTAIFELDFLPREVRYWLRYESESTNSTATLSFRNTPGYHSQSPLKQ